MWFDQPPNCTDPNTCKDSNLGLVNNTDNGTLSLFFFLIIFYYLLFTFYLVYVILTNRMASIFPTLDKIHGNSCATFSPKCFSISFFISFFNFFFYSFFILFFIFLFLFDQ